MGGLEGDTVVGNGLSSFRRWVEDGGESLSASDTEEEASAVT